MSLTSNPLIRHLLFSSHSPTASVPCVDGQSFDSLFGAYPGANGVPKGLVAYRPQVDVNGNVLSTLPPCANANPATCGFPSNLPNTFFDGSAYIPSTSSLPFNLTQGYYQEYYQINNGRDDRFATPNTPGYPQVTAAGAWTMAYYNLTGSYLFQLAQNYTVLDNHFHPAFGSSFANHLYLVHGRLPYFNNTQSGCASHGYVTAVDYNGNAIFSNNTIGRCTPNGRIFATTYPANFPPETYAATSPFASLVSGTVPSTPVTGSPQLSNLMPTINGTHIGDELDLAGVTWSWYSQGWAAVSSSPANFSAAPGFSWDHHPFVYFPKFANLSSPYAQSHQQDDSAFFSKLAAGTLEQVTFLKPTDANSFTPGTFTSSQAYLQKTMNSIFASPQYKAGTMLVYVTFSSNGGYADHGSVYKGDVDGPGTRVPGLLISPAFAGGRVNSQTYDEMAWVEMLERRFAISTSILNSTRSSVTRDLTNAFDDQTRPAVWDWAPQHVRTAFAGPGAHVVSFDTPDAYLPIGTQAYIKWGTSPSTMTNVVYANSTIYYSSSMVFHHAKITGLAFHTTYYYTIQYQTQATPYTFTSVRAQGDASPNQVIALVGDLGLMQTADNTVKQLSTISASGVLDFTMHVGDISYADTWADAGAAAPLGYDQIFEGFMDQTAPILANSIYMVLPGNHEANCWHGTASTCVTLGNNFTSYEARWRMPGAESGGLRSFWYSFDSGLIHWVIFNTETDFPNAPDIAINGLNSGPFAPAGVQQAWLAADLAAANANRGKVPFIVAAGHRPWIVFDTADACVACGVAFHNILTQYNVDLALFGHVHRYERSFPLGVNMTIKSTAQSAYNSSTSGTVFVVMGNAGNVEGHSQELANNNSWTASFNDQNYGYALLNVNIGVGSVASSLTYTMYNADNATLMDSFTISAKNSAVTGLAASALGDPQLKGFLGQSFQVHGLDGGVYSVISDEEVQINALFTFLSAGGCPPSSVQTQCWTHPGSYFGQVAIRTAAGGRLLLVSGPASSGFAKVELDGKVVALTVGSKLTSMDGSIVVDVLNGWQLKVKVGVYEMQLDSSDMFINVASIRVSNWGRLTQSLQPHGLLGQTWREKPVTVGLDVAAVEGQVDDYLEASNDLFGSAFLYNKFNTQNE